MRLDSLATAVVYPYKVLNHRPDVPSEPVEPVEPVDDDSEPLVDEMSILEVVTQSSRGRRAASEMRERSFSGEETVIDILADLVGGGDDEESEVEAEETERGDGDDDDDGDGDEEDEKETLEMTQVWIPPYFERGEEDEDGEDDEEEETVVETGGD